MAKPNIAYKQSAHRGAKVITPSDTVDLLNPVSAIYVGGIGNVTCVMANDDVVLFSAVPVGTILPVACVRVNLTGTTASLLVGLE
jgi:hypothetical protein